MAAKIKDTSKVAKPELQIIPFETSELFRDWLQENQSVEHGIWLRFYKKNSGKATITYDEALDEALCYGWIDGQVKKFDEDSYLQKFTPRRAKSLWSKRNIDKVATLEKNGRMKASGLKEVEAAKADGRWERAYDSQSTMKIPDDFINELSKDEKALAFFETLSKVNKYSIAYRLQTAKDAETREKRKSLMIEMLKRGEKFHE